MSLVLLRAVSKAIEFECTQISPGPQTKLDFLQNLHQKEPRRVSLAKLNELASPLQREMMEVVKACNPSTTEAVSRLLRFLTDHFSELNDSEVGALFHSLCGNEESFRTLQLALQQFDAKHDAQGRRLHTLSSVVEKARQYGIIPPMRCSIDTLPEIVRNRTVNIDDGRPVAILIMPDIRSDPQGAFDDRRENISQLVKNGYRVMLYTAKSEKDFEDAMHEGSSARKASVVIVAGHGSKTSVTLGPGSDEQNSIDVSDEEWLLRTNVGACLEAGGVVLIDSCNTGKGELTAQDNFANSMRRVFPHARSGGIYSCPVPNYGFRFNFNSDHQINEVWFFSTPSDGPGQGFPVYRS